MASKKTSTKSTINAGGGIMVDVIETPKASSPTRTNKMVRNQKAAKVNGKAAKNGQAKASKPSKNADQKIPVGDKLPRVKGGLRAGQVRILQVLSDSHGSLTRRDIAERARVTTGWAFNHIGPTEVEKRPETEKRTGYPCLLTLKFVKTKTVEMDSREVRTYEITAAGQKALDKIAGTV